jgi:hypothetical protein
VAGYGNRTTREASASLSLAILYRFERLGERKKFIRKKFEDLVGDPIATTPSVPPLCSDLNTVPVLLTLTSDSPQSMISFSGRLRI